MFSKKLLLGLHGRLKVSIGVPLRQCSGSITNEQYNSSTQRKSYEKTINQVTLLGRVGNEPYQRGTPEHPVLVFSVATHNNYRPEGGELVEKTDWHRVCVFKPALRELTFTYLRKGMRVHVSGKLSYGSVTEGTVTKHVTSVIAEDVIFLHHDGNS